MLLFLLRLCRSHHLLETITLLIFLVELPLVPMYFCDVILMPILQWADETDDDVIVYFCFPTLGAAVPLRPGNVLLFNALIPPCISSRCKQRDEVMCLSMYLKTACVGLNNNDLLLTTPQAVLARNYHEYVANHLHSPNCQPHLSHRYQKFYNAL